jgi:hypothetical protein
VAPTHRAAVQRSFSRFGGAAAGSTGHWCFG